MPFTQLTRADLKIKHNITMSTFLYIKGILVIASIAMH